MSTNGFNEEGFINYLNSDNQQVKKGDDGLYSIHPNYYEEYAKDKIDFEMFTQNTKEFVNLLRPEAEPVFDLDAEKAEQTEDQPVEVMEEPFPSSTLAQEGYAGSPESAKFAPFAKYARMRDEGENDFGRRYVEATYSGLAKLSMNTALLGTSIYDTRQQTLSKVKGFINLLRPHAEPIFEWKEINSTLDSPMYNATQEVYSWYQRNIFSKIDEVEGLGPGLVEGITQYVVPYFGARNLMATTVGNPAVKGILDNVVKEGTKRKVLDNAIIGTGGIGGATSVAAGPGDQNAIAFLADLFNLPEGDAETMYGRMYAYITTEPDLSNGVDADMVLREKTRAFFGDLAIDPALTGTLLLLTKTLGVLSKTDFGTIKQVTSSMAGKLESKTKIVNESILKVQSDNLFNYKTISKEQSIDSAATDVNFKRGAIPALYNKIDKSIGWKNNTTSLEIGSGAGNVSDNFLGAKRITNIKYDPYRLTDEQNADAVARINKAKLNRGGVDTVVIANVLNVIPEQSVRIRVLEQAKYAVKDNGKIYIDSHNAGKQGATRSGFQLGRSNEEYIPEIESVFGEGSAKIIKVSGRNFIEVTPTKVEGN